jgi:hypothetical protein
MTPPAASHDRRPTTGDDRRTNERTNGTDRGDRRRRLVLAVSPRRRIEPTDRPIVVVIDPGGADAAPAPDRSEKYISPL